MRPRPSSPPLFSALIIALFSPLIIPLFILDAPAADDTSEDWALARQNYMLNCQGCHLPDATGFEGAVPRMNGFVGNFLHVPGGREFIVQVPGVANAPISDQALAEVMNWVLINFSKPQLPQDFTPYTAAEIGTLRQTPIIDVQQLRPGLLDAIEKATGAAAR